MSFVYDMICKLNRDNYEHNVNVDTVEELKKDMVKYFEEYDLFDDVIDVDENDFKDEDGEVDELEVINEKEKQMYNYINSLIEWEGEGEYCLVGCSFGEPKIMKVDSLLEHELDYVEFPIPFTLELFNDTENYIIEWKKSKGYKYAYLVSFVCHVGMPYYIASHIVFSNNKIDNVINTLHEEKGIFIGEFNILGANYTVEEVENLSADDLLYYKFDNEYKVILMD